MNKIFTILTMVLFALFMLGAVVANPNGASTATEESSSHANAATASNHSAVAGNVTEITVSGDSITQAWQGYFGNVSGAINLADSSGNMMYNWSLASPQGEIFASTANSITWASIECFNWSANGTTLESSFNIGTTSADGVNETFSDGNSHAEFFVGDTTFSAGDCMSADIFDNTGASVDGTFEEVLLSDGTTTIFAALLEKDVTGFDSNSHDFQMLVLEDGHNADSSTTPYFFYVELE